MTDRVEARDIAASLGDRNAYMEDVLYFYLFEGPDGTKMPKSCMTSNAEGTSHTFSKDDAKKVCDVIRYHHKRMADRKEQLEKESTTTRRHETNVSAVAFARRGGATVYYKDGTAKQVSTEEGQKAQAELTG